jgi:hypothetical protein
LGSPPLSVWLGAASLLARPLIHFLKLGVDR